MLKRSASVNNNNAAPPPVPSKRPRISNNLKICRRLTSVNFGTREKLSILPKKSNLWTYLRKFPSGKSENVTITSSEILEKEINQLERNLKNGEKNERVLLRF